MDNSLEQAAKDLTILTSASWSFKPILSAPASYYEVEKILDQLQAAGAITGYRNASTFLRQGEDSKYHRSRPVAVEGTDAAKIRSLAVEAEEAIKVAEQSAHLLGLLLNTTKHGFNPQAVVQGDNTIRLGEVSPDRLIALKGLEDAGLIKVTDLRFNKVQVDLISTDAITAKIDPQLKEAAGILNLFGTISGYPWTYYPELGFNSPTSVASEIMEGIEQLKKAGVIDLHKTDRNVVVTVKDIAKLRWRGAAKRARIDARVEAKEIIGFLVGKTPDGDWFYNLNKARLKPVVDGLVASGAIVCEPEGTETPRDKEFSFYLKSFNFKKLRAMVDVDSLHRNQRVAEALNILANAHVSTVHDKYDWNRWHYSPIEIYKLPRSAGEVESQLVGLQTEGLIDFARDERGRTTVEVKDESGLMAKAQEARKSLDRVEDVGQVLKASVGDGAIFYRNGLMPSLRMDYVRGDGLRPLSELQAAGNLAYTLGPADVIVKPVDTQKLLAHLQPRLVKEEATYQRNAEAIKLLGIEASGEPWIPEYHIKPVPPYVEFGLMRRESAEYQKLDTLREAGVISFEYPEKPGPNGKVVLITVNDLSRLREVTQDSQKSYQERQEVIELLWKITGHQFHTSYGTVQTAYEYDEPVRDHLETTFEELKAKGAIQYEKWYAGRDETQDLLIVKGYDLDTLRHHIAAPVAPLPGGMSVLEERLAL